MPHQFEPGCTGPIGIFDSGYGGLTILESIRRRLPGYDYIYLGDNARAPYGSRSFELVYEFTLEAVLHLFKRGCPLVILACNTASAKALRSIQQQILPVCAPDRRVLGVIRPTVEKLGSISESRHVGILATQGTVDSKSYSLEIEKLYDGSFTVTEQAAPMWVPLIENGEASGDGADWFVRKYLNRIMSADPLIDTIILGCTHYPILLPKIRRFAPPHINIISQGDIVAESLADYLLRHPGMEKRCTHGGSLRWLTTEQPSKFDRIASSFTSSEVQSERIEQCK